MSGSGREAFPDVRVWSRGPFGCPGVVVRPARMSGCEREALPDVLEALPNVREGSEDPPRCPGFVGRPSRMSGDPSGCL